MCVVDVLKMCVMFVVENLSCVDSSDIHIKLLLVLLGVVC